MQKSVRKWSICFILFAGCYREHLYVQQEWVDRTFLASTHVGSPDPRQECPPEGQRILVAWRFPANLLSEQLTLILTVRFWSHTEETFARPIKKSRGHTAFGFFKERILTYRLQVKNERGEVLETWEHQFWTETIDVIDRSKPSVSSQPMHASVTETPY